MPPQNFYTELPPFSDFFGITLNRHFEPVPEDWLVFITDVAGSTRAVEAGRYKDVNTIGAASITVVQNVLPYDFPYVFGGDGATLLVPPGEADRVGGALQRLQLLARKNFGLELRVGRIPIRDLCRDGKEIEVARYQLVTGRCVAIFRGGGLSEAEKRLKSQPEQYALPGVTEGNIDLTGLSCRWNRIPNQRGRILTLLVLSRRTPPNPTYEAFLRFLNGVFGGNINASNPVNTDRLQYKSLRECLREECRYTGSRWSLPFLKRLVEIVAAVLIFRYRLPALIFDAPRYQASMRVHADYRKFDDILRMVIDCSPAQLEEVTRYLQARHAEGELYYGLHESDASLMTCFFQDARDGQHIHFIDGAEGGYSMASKQLKAQMAAP
ncbi:MAG: DUF3095 domain-containing protein [Verrucomicrobiae bacterium]|nr:DUF3095 domain-containing protein [Verrucomicrobiae bacterium]